MRNIILVAGLSLALAACGKSKWDKALSAMEDAKDKVCKCADKKCAEDAQKELFEKLEPMMKDSDKDDKPPKDVDEKGDKLMKEMQDCEKKLKDGAKKDGDAPKTP